MLCETALPIMQLCHPVCDGLKPDNHKIGHYILWCAHSNDSIIFADPIDRGTFFGQFRGIVAGDKNCTSTIFACRIQCLNGVEGCGSWAIAREFGF